MHVERLTLRDAADMQAAVVRSRALHHPWVAPPDTLEGVRRYLGDPLETRLCYGVRADDGELGGVVNLNAIIRGAFDNAFLGFYALSPYEGTGLMRQGLRAVIDISFSELRLHRLEANVQPANARSAALVRHLGFRYEGHSPRYLFIDGDWRDHDRYALTVEEWRS